MEETEYITKTNVLERNHWTKTAVSNLLDPPDKTILTKMSRRTCHLYLLERVKEVENSKSFLKFKNKTYNAKKAVETKTNNLLKHIDDLEIEVTSMPLKRVYLNAIDSYNGFNEGSKIASMSEDRKFLDRIAVNYIRHELTTYDETLMDLAGKTGKQDALEMLWYKIFNEISKVYPSLNSECSDQLSKKLGVEI